MGYLTIDNYDALISLLKNNKRIYVVGAGQYGELLGRYLKKNDIKWAGYIDKKGSGNLCGKSIIGYSDVKEKTDADTVFLLSSSEHAEGMAKSLNLEGIDENQIFAPLTNIVEAACELSGIESLGYYATISLGNKDPDITYMVMERRAIYEGIFSDAICFLHGCRFAEKNNMIPVIDRKTYPSFSYQNEEDFGIKNAWEYYYKQPGNVSVDYVYSDCKNIRRYRMEDSQNIHAMKQQLIYPDRLSREELGEWRRIVKKYLVLTDEIEKRIKDSYKALFPSENVKVLGVSIREGYSIAIEAKTKHVQTHKQPTIEKACRIVMEKMKEWECEYVFLACETTDAVEYFKNILGNKLITLSRRRLSYEEYTNRVKGFQKLAYSKSERDFEEITLDYITEIYLLSKTNCIFAGWSSGSSMSVLLAEEGLDHYEFFERDIVTT